MRSDTSEKIAFLSNFKADILSYYNGFQDETVRTRINRGIRRARELIIETGSLKTVTLTPPPALGGLVVRNADPFSFILQDYYGMSLIPTVCDMVDEAIGVLEDPRFVERGTAGESGALITQTNKRNRFLFWRAGLPVQNPVSTKEPEFPEKVTLSWLIRHVPISFWFWLGGIVVTAFAAGLKAAELLAR